MELWGKNTDNTLYIQESVKTPALNLQYNLLKSIPHISIMLDDILREIIIHHERALQHEIGLLKIMDILTELNEQEGFVLERHKPLIQSFV